MGKEELSEVDLLMATVVIENLPALEDYIDLAGRLKNIKGKFILSINDHPDMRDAFGAFNIKPVTLKYTTTVEPSTKGKELISTNY